MKLYDIIIRAAYVHSGKYIYLFKFMTKEECQKYAKEYGENFKHDFMIVESRR